MDASLRDVPALKKRLNKMRDDMLDKFKDLIVLSKNDTSDRNTAALTKYQMQVHTANIIRLAQECQTIIRKMQEMWLFGELNTIGDSKAQKQADEDAKDVAGLLQQLSRLQQNDAPQAEVPAEPVQANGPMQ